MRLVIDLIFSKPPTESHSNIPYYVRDLEERLMKVHVLARNKLELSSDRMKVRFNKKSQPMNFQEGDAVWLQFVSRD